MALFLPVEKKSAQKRMESLKRKGLFNPDYRVFEKEGMIWIPLRAGAQVEGAAEISTEPVRRRPKSIGEALAGVLEPEELAQVVNSFDLVGELAIVEIPETLVGKEALVAQAVIQVHPNVKTVAKKEGPMEGEFRVRRLKVIYGENTTETLYKENGAKMLLDPAKVYFSPRLSFERKRIAGLVKDGEHILALFAGVGPFPLVIAKQGKKCEIVAIELNPAAVEYMEKNILLNKAKDIKAICGDVKEIVPRDYANWADRILMPLPKDAELFLEAAYAGARNGAIIHFYTFADIGRPFEEAREKIARHLEKGKYEIAGERIVRPFSPAQVQVVLDIRAKK